LRRICDHGEALLPRDMQDMWRKREKGTLTWASLQSAARPGPCCRVCSLELEGGDVDGDGEKRAAEVIRFVCGKHGACATCVTSMEDGVPVCPDCPDAASTESSSSTLQDTVLTHRQSSKVRSMLSNILPTLQSRDSAGGLTAPIKRLVIDYTKAKEKKEKSLSPPLPQPP